MTNCNCCGERCRDVREYKDEDGWPYCFMCYWDGTRDLVSPYLRVTNLLTRMMRELPYEQA